MEFQEFIFDLRSRKNRQPQHLNEYCFIFFAKHCQRMDHCWKLKDNVYSKSSGCCFFTGKFLWAFKWVTDERTKTLDCLAEGLLWMKLSCISVSLLVKTSHCFQQIVSPFQYSPESVPNKGCNTQVTPQNLGRVSVRSVIFFLNYCFNKSSAVFFRAHN